MSVDKHPFNTPDELIEEIRLGRMVILVDDEDRENEGDLVLAADHVTPELINFMAREARGLICLALSPTHIERLHLPLMVREDSNFSPNKTAFTVSIEASSGVSTGISAADRAHTVRVAAHPDAKPSDIRSPGHIFPIRAQHGGVLRRAGHTEGSVDLAKLAGLNAAAVICEVMKDDGTMARVPDLFQFAQKHGIKIGTIVDLIEYRLSRDILVEELLDVQLPALLNGYRARVFRNKVDGVEHLVLQKGDIKADEPVLVRVHLDSYTRDLYSLIKQNETSTEAALRKIDDEGHGLFVLLRGANKPQGVMQEVKSLMGETQAVDMDSRDYGIGAQILRSVGARQIRLLSNKADRRVGLKAFDLEIVDVVPLHEEIGESQNQETNATQNRSGHFPLQ